MSSQPDTLSEYKSTEGVAKREANLVDEHPLKETFGQDKERRYDAQQAGARFVNMYDDPAAAIRESLSNAETACINRAEVMLEDAGMDVPSEVREILAKAKDKLGYEAQIDVSYNQSPNETTLVIEDNGIGITPERYEILLSIGYSENHMSGDRAGQFGIGYMSHWLLVGVNGSFRMKTNPYGEYDAYSTAEYLGNFEYLPDEKDTIGTKFEFPALTGAAQNIDIASSVETYTQGMQVQVVYREFDENGVETNNSEEYTPLFLESKYDGDEIVVTYEDEYFKVVMPVTTSPSDGYRTYNVTMPIKRNTNAFGTTNEFHASSKWDFRGKKENGPIVKCEDEPSCEGLVPIEDTKYQMMAEWKKESHIPMSDVPDDAIRMPKPASSRDSYMGKSDDFWRYVSDCVQNEWKETASELFADLSDKESFIEADQKDDIIKGYEEFVGYTSSNSDMSAVADKIGDTFDTTVDASLAKILNHSLQSVDVVREGVSNPKLQSSQEQEQIYDLISEYGTDVYIGASISQKKAEIIWGLGGAAVVVGTAQYDYYQDLYGWNLAKDLPHSNLSEKLPELDESVANEWENKQTSKSSGSGSGSNKRTSRDPTSKEITIRYRTNTRSGRTKRRVSSITSDLQNGDVFWGRRDFDKLIVHDQNDSDVTASTVARSADKYKGIAGAQVPKYVYDYLLQFDSVYEDAQVAIEENKHTTFTVDGVEHDTEDLSMDDTLVLYCDNRLTEFDAETIAEYFGVDTTQYSNVFVVSTDILSDYWGEKVPDAYKSSNGPRISGNYYTYDRNVEYDTIVREERLKNVDESHEHYEFLFESVNTSEIDEALEIADELGMIEN